MKSLTMVLALLAFFGIAYSQSSAPFTLKVVPSAQVPFGEAYER